MCLLEADAARRRSGIESAIRWLYTLGVVLVVTPLGSSVGAYKKRKQEMVLQPRLEARWAEVDAQSLDSGREGATCHAQLTHHDEAQPGASGNAGEAREADGNQLVVVHAEEEG